MWEKVISYFARRHLLTNLLVAAVFMGGVFAWQHTNKEELPDVTFNSVRVSVSYPGAPAEDVEFFVTKPIEEEVRGLDGVYRVSSTSSVGKSNISIELEQDLPNLDEVITEIRSAVLDVDMPAEVRDDPNVRVFKTSKKAILDIAIFPQNTHFLDIPTRRELQKLALALENQLVNLPEINSINKRGYLQPEIQIRVHPEKLREYDIPFNTVMQEVEQNNIRRPAGTLENSQEPKVTLVSELDTSEKLRDLIIQGGFEGQVIRLSQVADIVDGFEKNESVTKVNGREAVMFSVVKNSSYGILEALDAVYRSVDIFRKNSLKDTDIEVVFLDDESIDIRNRLSLIGINGTIGFVLILLTLFVFLDKSSGLWVAMGIPFTFCFTMIAASMMGYTINGTTLAAVIIVMGIVVDDAIVVAENVSRLRYRGMPREEAVVKGTAYVLLPIIASIVTTCIAFVPLFFFEARFAKIIKFIPPIIFLMLGASLFEAMFILPGHLNLHQPLFGRLCKTAKKAPDNNGGGHWFERIEDGYGCLLKKVLPLKGFVFAGFVLLLVFSVWVVQSKMKFVMFPNEETRDIVVNGSVPPGAKRYETAKKTREIEDVLAPYIGREVVGVRTEIARSRRGGAVEENKFRMIVEIVSKEKRKKSADQLIREFKQLAEKLPGFQKLEFQKSRWGSSSGSAIELVVQQNNDELRASIVERLAAAMRNYPHLENVEIDEGYRVPEYRIAINREMLKRLSINPVDIGSTFRAALEGSILYEFSDGDEDVQTRFTVVDSVKDDINKVLALPVENKGDYLVPLRDVVLVEETLAPNSISRLDLKRTTRIDAALKKGTKRTPLEIAEHFEQKVFPDIMSEYPTTTLSFEGEVKDTRESQGDLINAVYLALLLIYITLAVLLNSMFKPIIIMLAIPFGLVGVVLAFWLHGKVLFGFYAAVGALGLAGVVINDSIIMLVKLDKEYDRSFDHSRSDLQISGIAQTRLRAVVLTTVTTVAGVLPTAYGFAGYDAMLAEMMLALAWGMVFGTLITLLLIPCVYSWGKDWGYAFSKRRVHPDD